MAEPGFIWMPSETKQSLFAGFFCDMNDTSITDLAPILDLPLLNYISLFNVTLDDPGQVQQLRDRGVQVDGQP